MKKILLSLAVVAASGAYVAYEGPLGVKAGTDIGADIDALASAAEPAKAISPAPVANAGSPLASQKLLPEPAAAPIATPAPTAFGSTSALGSLQAPLSSAAVQAAAVAPSQARTATRAVTDLQSAPAIPLPLPRPADAPTVIKAAQSSRTQSAYLDGTFKGISADAYYGRVQVDAVIQAGQLVSVDVLSYPNDRRTSRNINSRALPELEREAIQAQSANIDGVSGATLTSTAYEQSLDAALSAARTGGNNA